MKRNYNPYIQNKKPTPSSSSDSLARIKAKLAEKNAAKATADATSSKGLDVEIHPLLRTSIPISNLQTSKNPLRANAKRQFDPTSLNPYLDQSATTIKPRTHKPLAFNEHGKYISQGNKMREKLSRDLLEEEKLARFRRDGLAANEDLGEQLYKPTMPPAVEWWDRPYLKTSHYSDNFVLDSEDAPITEYVQHPSFVPAPWERHLPQQPQPLKLTKQEMKKIRRNDRLEKHKDKQDRIKLGLDEPPAPKVKLLNLMNVLTNEAIQDPTALEMRVRQEVEERFNKHMEENESRKLTSEEKHAKQHLQNIKQLEQGYYTSVYKINTLLGNPKNFYKLDVNAKQLELVGICLINPKFNLVVVQGD